MPEIRWKVTVDGRRCQSSGVCASLAPKRFAFTSRGARPVEEEIPEDVDVLEAAEVCPLQAITIVDTRSGAVIMPEPA